LADQSPSVERLPRILAVASQGGHWDQLMLLRPALEQFEVRYATTSASLGERDGIPNVLVLTDANRASGIRGLRCFLEARRIVRAVRPDVVISTGAMPGLFCLLLGRSSGARTVWIDSIANSEQQSLSGRLAGKFATLWLTQWEHLARPGGPAFWGAVF
jgi:UDP-N-acetylglucosamine:LPS N-acetylglucosamine transferase